MDISPWPRFYPTFRVSSRWLFLALLALLSACGREGWLQSDTLSEKQLAGTWTPHVVGTYFRDLADTHRMRLVLREDGSLDAYGFPFASPEKPGPGTVQRDISGKWSLRRNLDGTGGVSWSVSVTASGIPDVKLQVFKLGNRLLLETTVNPLYNPISYLKSSD